jgi:cyclase
MQALSFRSSRALAALVLLGACASLSAQASAGQAPAAPAQPNFAAVEIKTTKITNTFYTLIGQGGTTGVLVGPDGVFMVDGQFAPLTDKIVAAIKQISDGRIRFLVNTHVHVDHTGGNENFGKMGVTILARENLRKRLAKPDPGGNGSPDVPAPPVALPVLTYDAPIVVHMNGEDIRIIPVPVAHTDGDSMVYFPTANVIMTGDFYRSVGYPNIDLTTGGSLKGMLDGLAAVINLANPATKIIPGHGSTVDKAAVLAHRDMIIAVRDHVAALIKQGKTLDEVVAAKVTAEPDAKVEQPANADRFVGQVYAQLKAVK